MDLALPQNAFFRLRSRLRRELGRTVKILFVEGGGGIAIPPTYPQAQITLLQTQLVLRVSLRKLVQHQNTAFD